MLNDNQQSATRRSRVRAAVFAVIVILALIIDQVSKSVAERALSDGRTIEVIPRVLSLTLVHNPGASLGMGANMTWIISVLAIIACCVLLWMAMRTTSMIWTVFLALAFSGALGNLIDRIAYADGFLNGKVIDFLNYGWSVGNIADVFLMVAGIGIVVLIMCSVPFRKGADAPTSDERKNTEQD